MSEPSDKTRATIAVTSKGKSWGEIVLRFYPDVAPNTSETSSSWRKRSSTTGRLFTE